MGNTNCTMCGEKINGKLSSKTNKLCTKCITSLNKCQLCDKLNKSLYLSFHIYPFRHASVLNKCIFCGLGLNQYNDQYGRRYNGFESVCQHCTTKYNVNIINKINDDFNINYVRYCLLCNSVTEKCTVHRNPSIDVCGDCYTAHKQESLNLHNHQFCTNTSHYSNNKLYDDFIRRDPSYNPINANNTPPYDNYYSQCDEKEKRAEFESYSDELCVVCDDREIETVIIPCGHMCLCGICSNDYENNKKNWESGCPMCRTPIQCITTTFKP